MTQLTDILDSLDGKHRSALDWFNRHKGQRVRWQTIQEFSSDVARLVNQAKGIYKLAYSDCALSIRTTQDSPYADTEVEHRPDGSWIWHYYQENPNPDFRDKEATNRGLVRCMETGTPIGAMIKRKPIHQSRMSNTRS